MWGDLKQMDQRGAIPMVTIEIPDVQLLVADDDRAFRETVVEILAPRFHIIAVESAEQALEIFGTTDVHLALFDMHMHVMSGLDAIRWLRENQLEIPCILLTSDLSPEIEDQAHELQTFSVLRKPPRQQQLIDTISCALEL